MKNTGDRERFLIEDKASEPSDGLLGTVMLHIADAETHRFRRRIVFFAGLAMIAAASFVPAWRELSRELSSSGFSSFLSLLSSDTASFLADWKEFLMSLLESLPVFGLAAVLGALFTLLSSLRLLALNLTGGSHYARIAKHHG
jgi:hypothetical protein